MPQVFKSFLYLIDRANDPNGTRTRVAGVKGRCPRPLDDGAVANEGFHPPTHPTVYRESPRSVKGTESRGTHGRKPREIAEKTSARRGIGEGGMLPDRLRYDYDSAVPASLAASLSRVSSFRLIAS